MADDATLAGLPATCSSASASEGPFAAAVRAALADRTRAILGETEAAWRGLQHRELAERIKALVAQWRLAPAAAAAGDLLPAALGLTDRLRVLQGPGGLFTGGDNVDSPPDTAFSVNDLADALLLLRSAGDVRAGGQAGENLVTALESLLAAAAPALISGGVHTPNHRWELSAALARLHLVMPRPALLERITQWLAEGIDIDADGLYSERSAIYAAYVSNPSLLLLAEVLHRPELVDAVEHNLDATLDLLLPDGSVETVMSRRQDQHGTIRLADYLLPLRRVAQLRGRGDLAWAAGLALDQGITAPAEAATRLLLDPGIGAGLPAAVPPRRARRRHFESAGLLVDHRPAGTTTVLFGGSDYARHRRIRSGLANSPTFLRLFAGRAVLDSVRLSRSFFGLGPFRSDGLTVAEDAQGATITLVETVSAAYYQPLAPGDRDASGQYELADEGRFSGAMDFGRRAGQDVSLTTRVEVRLTDTGAELTFELSGAAVDWALELAFRPGGTMTGARALADDTWQLDPVAAIPPITADYRVHDDAITVTVLEASDGHGKPLPAPAFPPRYEPGEEYRFLHGTDAATGERLYLAGRVPGRVRLQLCANPS